MNGEQQPAPAPEEAKEPAAPPVKRKRKAAAKKAAAPKKAARKKTASASTTKGADSASQLIKLLGGRAAQGKTKKAKLLAHMLSNKGKRIPQIALVVATYGNKSKDSVTSFSACMNGLTKTLKSKKSGYQIVRRSEDEEVTFELVSKD